MLTDPPLSIKLHTIYALYYVMFYNTIRPKLAVIVLVIKIYLDI